MPAKTFKKGMKKEEKNEVISSNIREELKKHPKMPIKQAVAIAYSEAAAKKKKKK